MLNEIDNNIFDHLTGGILIRDTNNVIIAYNLFLDCAEVCVDTVSGINGPRPIGGHTNDVHNLMVHDNGNRHGLLWASGYRGQNAGTVRGSWQGARNAQHRPQANREGGARPEFSQPPL